MAVYSFEQTARELNCGVGLLRRAVEDNDKYRTVSVPALSEAAYAAVAASEVVLRQVRDEDGQPRVAKVVIPRKKKWVRKVQLLAEFPGYFAAQAIAREGGMRGDQLEELANHLRHPVVRLPALTEEISIAARCSSCGTSPTRPRRQVWLGQRQLSGTAIGAGVNVS